MPAISIPKNTKSNQCPGLFSTLVSVFSPVQVHIAGRLLLDLYKVTCLYSDPCPLRSRPQGKSPPLLPLKGPARSHLGRLPRPSGPCPEGQHRHLLPTRPSFPAQAGRVRRGSTAIHSHPGRLPAQVGRVRRGSTAICSQRPPPSPQGHFSPRLPPCRQPPKKEGGAGGPGALRTSTAAPWPLLPFGPARAATACPPGAPTPVKSIPFIGLAGPPSWPAGAPPRLF